jgi:serine/threonine protein kinase/tetratricopeptide (TPR) repeat protein
VELPQVIADRFEIEALVGSGGMGDVFRAHDRLTGGRVAIKVLHGSMPRDAERFRREAQVLAELSHPRVVKYVAHGMTPANRPYIAMEWLEGEDLAERLSKSGVTIEEAVTIGKRVAEGLSVLHDKGFLHRDVKPSNLFLLGNDVHKVKLLDLGIVRSVNPTRVATKSGITVGTPGYMAPEQARGARELDARVDVFALGCVLFECLAGRPAFVGENMAALLAKILLEPPGRVRDLRPEVPEALDDLVARMLAKEPVERPANGAAALRELDALRLGSSVESSRRPSFSKARSLTGDERRLLSVVMAQSASSSPLDTTREHEVLPSDETIEAPFEPRAIVASFGATAEWLADGSLVVTVAGRGSATDQAAHAARCALALRPHLLDATLVLATGLATMGDRSPLGEVIDRASTLLANLRARRSAAPSWDTAHGFSPIFLDETTAGLLDMRFDVGGDERGLFIRGLREREGTTRTLLGKSTPCVGRDRELSTLQGLLDECVQEPVARAVLVTAPAGYGKSRLGQEFVRVAREQYRDAEVWIARGDPMSQGSPFSMLARGVRRACGSAEGEPLGVRQQKLRARFGRHLSGDALTHVSEFLGELAGTPFTDTSSVQLRAARQDAILMGDQMTRAFEDWVAAECAQQPVILILEDLQWGDLPSIKILDSALRNLADKPFLVLALARPDVHELFPNLWEERSLQELRLGPLMKRASERLVREVLGDDVAPETVTRLVERASGNAFYLEELVRAVAEGRGDKLPETVLAMVEARVEQLDASARRVLRAASVFGETFWRGGVAEMFGGQVRASEVDDWLGELVHREIIGKKSDSRFPRDAEFVFRHGLVREAAYAMLTAEDRVLAHRMAGEWLEKSGETEPLVLAEHFERGGVKDRAATLYRRAARDALEGNDFSATLARAERALACDAANAALGKIRLLQAEAHAWQGHYAEGAQFAEQALAALEPGSDDWFEAAAELANACWRLGEPKKVMKLAETIQALDAGGLATPSRIAGTARIAQRLIVLGSYADAEPLVRWLEAQDIPEDEPALRGWLESVRATRAMWLGDIEEEVRALHAGIEHFDRAGDRRNACTCRQNAAHCLISIGALEEAEKVQRQVVEAATRMGLRALAISATQSLGLAVGRQGRFSEGMEYQRQAIAGFSALGNVVWAGISMVYLALVMRLVGDFEEAETYARKGLAMVESVPSFRAGALAGLARILLDRGKNEEAHQHAKEAWEIYQKLGGLVEAESLLRVTLAETHEAIGDRVSAKDVIREARDRLLLRAERIKIPEWRTSFLEKIRENALTLARAKEWLGDPN